MGGESRVNPDIRGKRSHSAGRAKGRGDRGARRSAARRGCSPSAAGARGRAQGDRASARAGAAPSHPSGRVRGRASARLAAGLVAGGRPRVRSGCGAQSRSAAALWGCWSARRRRSTSACPDGFARADGIRARQANLLDDERTVHAGIPVTTVPRTLLDLAAVVQEHELRRALERGGDTEARRPDPLGCPRRAPPRPQGRGQAEGSPPAAAPDHHEERARAPLPGLRGQGRIAPAADQPMAAPQTTLQVDCVWPEQRLIVELDSRTYHRTTAAFERDRKRDRRLVAAQWRVIRVTDQAMRLEGGALRGELGALLSRPEARARSA